MSARWLCKACKRWGLGGADGWLKHWEQEHRHDGHYGAHVSFGFTGDLEREWPRMGTVVARAER